MQFVTRLVTWDTRGVRLAVGTTGMALVGLLIDVALAGRPQPPGDGPCLAERASQHRAWQTTTPPRDQPSTTTGARVRHFPTSTLGVWVVETTGAEGASMVRVSADDVTRVTWTTGCAAAIDRRARPRLAAPRVTDADLTALLRHGRGVVYVWSPHMPLSVDAIAPLSAAARAHDLMLTLVLDPGADRAFAARIATERGLPASALRVADSVELQFRDVLVHAPAVQVYANGRMVGSAFPGGHTTDEYDVYFRRVLTAP